MQPARGAEGFTKFSSTGIATASSYSAWVMKPSLSMKPRMTSRRSWLAAKFSGEPSERAPGCCTIATRLAAWAGVASIALMLKYCCAAAWMP